MELGRIFADHNRYSHQNTNHQCWVCCCSDHVGLLAGDVLICRITAVSRVQPALDTGTKQPETFRKHSQFIWHWNAEACKEQRRLQWQWSDDATTPANSNTHNYLPSSMAREAAWWKLLILLAGSWHSVTCESAEGINKNMPVSMCQSFKWLAPLFVWVAALWLGWWCNKYVPMLAPPRPHHSSPVQQVICGTPDNAIDKIVSLGSPRLLW